ncbi:hypothetical protein Droror1_Dr00027612 [Drosera rotundifolia]
MKEKSIAKKLCNTVSELALGIMSENNWPESLSFMFQCLSSSGDRDGFKNLSRVMMRTLTKALNSGEDNDDKVAAEELCAGLSIWGVAVCSFKCLGVVFGDVAAGWWSAWMWCLNC